MSDKDKFGGGKSGEGGASSQDESKTQSLGITVGGRLGAGGSVSVGIYASETLSPQDGFISRTIDSLIPDEIGVVATVGTSKVGGQNLGLGVGGRAAGYFSTTNQSPDKAFSGTSTSIGGAYGAGLYADIDESGNVSGATAVLGAAADIGAEAQSSFSIGYGNRGLTVNGRPAGDGQSKVDGGAGTDTLGVIPTAAPATSTRPQARPQVATQPRVSTQSAPSRDGGKGGGGRSTAAAPVQNTTDASGRDGGKGGGGGNDAADTMTGRGKSRGGFLGGGLFGGRTAGSGSEIGFSGSNSGGGFWGGLFGGSSSGSSTGTGTTGGESDGGGGGGGSKPVLLDLNRDGLELNFDRNAQFDIDGDGFREGITWAGASDGLLAVDLSADGSLDGAGDGVIDQADEIAFANWGEDGMTDLQALAEARDAEGALIFDSNGDGHLNAQDKHWKAMKVFQDIDQDGMSDAGEVQSLEDWGITDIALFYDDGSDFSDHSDDHVFEDGSVRSGVASITQHGEVIEGAAHDMTLGYNTMGSREFLIGGEVMVEYEDGRIVNKATGELMMQGQPFAQGGHGADVIVSDETAPESLAETAERRAQQSWGMITGAVAAGAVASTQLAAQESQGFGEGVQAQSEQTLSDLTGTSGDRALLSVPDEQGALPSADTSNAALSTNSPASQADVENDAPAAGLDAGSLAAAKTVSELAQLQSPLSEGQATTPTGQARETGIQSDAVSPQQDAALISNLQPDDALSAAREEVRIANDPFHYLRNERGPVEIWADIQKQRALEAEQAAEAGLSIEEFKSSQDAAALAENGEAAEMGSEPVALIDDVPTPSQEAIDAMAILRANAPDPIADQIRLSEEFELTQAATKLFNAGHEIPKDLTLDMARDLLVQMNGPTLSPEDAPEVDPVALDLMRMEQSKLSLSKPQEQGSMVPRNGEDASPYGMLVPPAA